MLTRRIVQGLVAVVAGFGLAQLVPYGRDHRNPPVVAEPAWSSPEVRSLARRACFDCHSNQTRWPGYSRVAPMSWLIERHVNGGREEMNFSEWNRPQHGAEEFAKEINSGSMPPLSYRLLHPEARLSADERQRLVQGLRASGIGRGADRTGRGGHDGD